MGGGPGAGRGRAEWAARRGGSGRRRGVGSGAGEGEGWCLPRPSPVLKPSRRPRSPAAPPVRAGFWGDSRAFPAVPAEERPRRRLPLCCASTGTRVLRPSSAQAAPHPHSLRARLRGPAWLDPPVRRTRWARRQSETLARRDGPRWPPWPPGLVSWRLGGAPGRIAPTSPHPHPPSPSHLSGLRKATAL